MRLRADARARDSVRFLHVYSGNLWGGIEVMLATIGRCSGDDDVHEFALCYAERLAVELERSASRVYTVGPVRLRAPWTVLRARRALAAIVRHGRFDAVIYHAPWSYALLAVALPPGVRRVFWMHDIARGTHWTERIVRLRSRPDVLLSNSAYTGASAGALWKGAHPCVVHCPVDLQPVPDAQERLDVRASMKLRAATVVVVQAGRLEAWKGHALLLDALAQLGDGKDWEYWVIGGAQRPEEELYLASLRARADRAGISSRVRFLGQRSDVSRLLGGADVFCQPTATPEPFGVAVVEALAAGLPVIATTPGGVAEIVTERCGVLVPSGAVDVLAGELRRLLENTERRHQLGSEGPARARVISQPAQQLRRLRGCIAGVET